MTPASPREVLEPWIAARLRPLDAPATPHAWIDGALGGPLHAPAGDYAQAAVLVGLVAREAGLSVILTRRSDTLKRHSGQVALPGGRLEPGETPVQAALREAWEEIGLDPGYVEPVGQSGRYCTYTGFDITPVVAFVRPGFTLAPAAEEVAEVFEAPFAFLMDPRNYEERTWEGPGGGRRYYAVPHGERLIWGATAGMLNELRVRLFPAEAISPQSPPRAAAGR